MPKVVADVAIAGSGAGGAALAGELARAGAQVILVEAGPSHPGPAGGHIRNRLSDRRSLVAFGELIQSNSTHYAEDDEPLAGAIGAKVIHAVGGMLSHWTHHCVAPDRSEWPAAIPWGEAAGLLDRAAHWLRSTTSIYDGGDRQRRLIETGKRTLAPAKFGRPIGPIPVAGELLGPGDFVYSGADALLRDPQNAGRLSILSEHIVQAVLLNKDEAAGLHAVNRSTGESVSVLAPVVVVAAGAIGTPKILFASGIRPWALGRFVTDHPMLASRLALRTDLVDGVSADDTAFGVWIPMGPARRRHVQIVQAPLAPAPSTSPTTAANMADIYSFTGVTPQSENALSLTDARQDPFGLPGAEVNLNLTSQDVRELSKAMAEQLTLAAALGDVNEGWRPELLPAGSSFHLMGTSRIGRSPDNSVLDSMGRVWGFGGLYAAGNGVLSEYAACNPTLMTVACALRSADAITGRLSADQRQVHEPQAAHLRSSDAYS